MLLHRRPLFAVTLLCGSLSLAFDASLPPARVRAASLTNSSAHALLREAPTVAMRSTGPIPATPISDFERHIVDAAKEHGVRVELIRAIIQTESEFDPLAVSNRGACGLMQLMPRTARSLGVVDCFDARENIQAGTRYLKSLLLRYRGCVSTSIAAYNAGEGAVARHRGIPPYRQTQDYVRKVTALL